MNASSEKKFFVALVTLAMMLSSASIFAGTASANVVAEQMGDFYFSYDNVTSTLYNVEYKNTNYTINTADSIASSGRHAPAPQSGKGLTADILQLDNVTVKATEDNDMLLLSTTNSSAAQIPTITINLPGVASNLTLTSSQRAAILENCNLLISSFIENPIYRLNVTDGFIYYFSNSPSELSNGSRTIVFQNNSFTPGTPLVVGITPSGTIKYSMEKQKQSFNLSLDPLTYDPGTGDVTGTYLSMNFDPSTGIISDYTNLYTGTKVFDQIYSTGNGSIGGGFIGPLFPEMEPMLIGSVFYYANNTAVYQIHNSLSTMGNFFIDNGTAFFNVDSALNVTIFNPIQNAVGPGHKYGSNYSDFSDLGLGNQFMVQAAPTIVVISNDNFRGELFVHEGTVTVAGNTISISSSSVSHITFVAQVWFLQAQLEVRNQLQYAIQHGMLGAMVSVGPNGPSEANSTTYYNSSMQLTVQNMVTNRFQIQLESRLQHGTSLAVFIPNEVMKNNSQFTLRYDNQEMVKANSMNGVLNSTSQNQSAYFLTPVNGGTLVVLNVPHFTTHTFEISATSNAGAGNLWLYVIVTVVVIGGAGITAFFVARRGRRS